MNLFRASQVARQAVVLAAALAAVPSRDLWSQATGTAEPIRQRGLTPFPNARLARLVLESDLEAIVISPSFSNDDNNASRFPSLGEGEFLEAVLKDVRKDHALRPKILLTGYSRGGQFSHRYALAHPERVAAVAPLASGTWTTPDGRFLVENVGEVRNAREFLVVGSAADERSGRATVRFAPSLPRPPQLRPLPPDPHSARTACWSAVRSRP